MPAPDLRELVAPGHTALILQEAQRGVMGTESALPALAEAATRSGATANMARLAAAARLDPANARFAYVYAVALNDAGQTGKALVVLEDNLAQHPYDRDSLAALANFYQSAGYRRKAVIYAKRLAELEPNDAQVEQQLMQLKTETQP